MTTLGTMATNIFVLDLQNNHQIIGDHRKLILEEKKVIICCLNCTEIIRSTLLISQREKDKKMFAIFNQTNV